MKTGDAQASVGSNPTLSAIFQTGLAVIRPMRKYPSGRRGSPAKGVDVQTTCEGSNPSFRASSEIPITALFPPCGENCAVMGISSLPTATRSSPALMAGEAAACGGTSWARSWEDGSESKIASMAPVKINSSLPEIFHRLH